MQNLSEAEIQVLIALGELAQPLETPNNNFYRTHPADLAAAAAYFRGLRADWRGALGTLLMSGCILPRWRPGEEAPADDAASYALTPAGLALSLQLRRARPPIYYWYREFYADAPRSPAFRSFCAELYGRYLCQTGFCDLAQLQALLAELRLGPGQRALDLGCGPGLAAAYLAQRSGAAFGGLDYCPEAVEQAQALRPAPGGPFSLQNLDELDLPPAAFDALVALDTLYMPSDLPATLRAMAAALRPGGRMGLFYSTAVWDVGGERARLQPQATPLAAGLRAAGLPFRTLDFSAANHALLQRRHRLAQAARPAFAAEGRAWLCDHLLAESEPDPAPYDAQTCAVTRYLYLV